jgi:colanic acid/amylovoran biosynthesis glycosyltransferase
MRQFAPPPQRPRVVSLCGTWLKPEMQSIYRQVTGLRDHESIVFTEQIQNPEQFPWEHVITMARQARPRLRGNFILRFWYKYVTRQWPPPRPIQRETGGPYFSYDLPQLLRHWQPGLVHAYYGHKAVKYHEMLTAWGGPWLVSFHGVDVVKFTHDPRYVAALQRVFADAQLVLARSESLLRVLADLGCPREKLRLNRTPIPLDRFPITARTAPPDQAWRLVQACRLIAKKGLYTTLAALEKVVVHFPNLRFILCGTGPERDRFLAAVTARGLQKNVELRGWMDQAELLAEYEKAHVFLHPSELTDTSDQEGIPNSMLEAMATGLPVIATQHGGIPEAVTHGHDGLLVPEKSPDALADAIISLLRDPARLASFGAAAARNVRAAFGADASIGALEACYAEALAKARSQ